MGARAAEHAVGMMLLFGGGLALGNIVNGSGAGAGIAKVITDMHLTSDLAIIVVFVLSAVLISELTNSTVSAAVTIPIILTLPADLFPKGITASSLVNAIR